MEQKITENISEPIVIETIEPTVVENIIPIPVVKKKRVVSEKQRQGLIRARAAKAAKAKLRRAQQKIKQIAMSHNNKTPKAKPIIITPVQPIPNINEDENDENDEKFNIDWKSIGGAIITLSFVVAINIGKTYFINWWNTDKKEEEQQNIPEYSQADILRYNFNNLRRI